MYPGRASSISQTCKPLRRREGDGVAKRIADESLLRSPSQIIASLYRPNKFSKHRIECSLAIDMKKGPVRCGRLRGGRRNCDLLNIRSPVAQRSARYPLQFRERFSRFDHPLTSGSLVNVAVQYMFQGEPEREAWAFPPVLTSHHVIRAHRACRTPPAGLLQLSDCARSLTASSASANDPGGPVLDMRCGCSPAPAQ